ncbi:SDR family NAD(P)-dependent oxidoreductase [Amycolatopsis acidicola]|uniref:SDR family NAD(P)-dependent oxidoreductase n=1 Tax=Amycolatopsis acidicola TaxID=2596893 RepID=A0A5N0UZ66_9PSEU|nr:SDR family NAD(P)-dependent oxidoreductase [Amycolatopsis acidicola]KAA9156539.1 SDR family NAD(P)-dependent oxidoreductase [Amycolatopsis acidicola]
MKILVTGASGYIGSHTLATLRRRGHEVRALARNPERLRATLAPFGVDAEVATGDMTDENAVATALQGCDAVIHAAGEVGVSGGVGPKGTANADGVRTVVGQAIEAGIGPVVYTSTVGSYLPATDPVITLDTPLAEPLSSYGASKRQAEELVLEWQSQGAPVVDFTVGGVYGPQSPHLEGGFSSIVAALGTFMLVPDGGVGVIDVRDLARLLANAVEAPAEPRRYLAGGRFLTWAEWTETLAAAAGCEVPHKRIASADMIDLGRRCDEMRAQGKEAPPLSEEAAIVMTSAVPTDDSATLSTFGCEYRPTVDTFRDTVEWLREQGAVKPRAATHG